MNKISLPLAIILSGLGGAVTTGVTMGMSKQTLAQNTADITTLKDHDRQTYGDVQEVKADVKDLRAGVDRIERHLGTK